MPLSGNEEWRSKLAKLPVPLAVSSDPLSMACLKSLIEEGRVSREQGISLFENPSLSSVSSLADMVKKSRYGNNVFFNENLHVNTTNVCVLACRFCAFRKGPRHPEAYSLDIDEYLDRIRPLSESIDEVHTVGGCLLYTSPSPRDRQKSRMPSSA